VKRIVSIFSILSIVALALAVALALDPATGYAQAKKEKAKKERVDLNKASEQELAALKGIGPATAKKIIENRPYKSVNELSKAGLSAKAIKDLKPFVTVGRPAPAAKPAKEKGAVKAAEKPDKAAKAKPAKEKAKGAEKAAAPKLAPGQKVNINTATKEQLEALPEIGPVKAQAIIDGRPYQKPEDIMKVRGIKEGIYGKIKDHITVR
jgi:competence protein ComEA